MSVHSVGRLAIMAALILAVFLVFRSQEILG